MVGVLQAFHISMQSVPRLLRWVIRLALVCQIID